MTADPQSGGGGAAGQPSGDAPAAHANAGPGKPEDALTAALQAVAAGVKNPPAEPAPDPRVSAAFALGWQMAELYRPAGRRLQAPASREDLPGLNRLGDDERAWIALSQVEAALQKLSDAVKGAGLELPETAPIKDALTRPPDWSGRAGVIKAFHVKVLSTLTAADFRLGKAYGVGRSFADTCRSPVSARTLMAEFKPHRIAKLRASLDDLATALPPHAGHSVGESLDEWVKRLYPQGKSDEAAALEALAGLGRQGQLWRALLSGEKAGKDMLHTENYLEAANSMLKEGTGVAAKIGKRLWWVFLIALVLLGVGIWLLIESESAASIVAGAGTILASLGLTWRSVGTAAGGLAPKLEQHLWGAELDRAIAGAITMLPGNKKDHAKRLATAVTGPMKEPIPQQQLLSGVLDPARLLDKVSGLQHQSQNAVADLAQLTPDQRLPPGHLDSLRADIEAEQHVPERVARASSPAPPGGAKVPPPVIYMSRKPAVSQFMSVITYCFEQEVSAPALERATHLGALDQVWRDIERWTEDLRSRFRAFGPCDIRFIEPKLAQVLAGFEGRHLFNTNPPTVRLGDQAKVFVLGDWATGLPQARNVAARIGEKLKEVPPGLDCHVVHLGDTYYSGLEDECRRRFLDLWPVAPEAPVRSWTLAGNHDMYSGGHGYFEVLLADPRFAAQSRCSYFALANDHWQLLGMDSAYNNPDSGSLEQHQRTWLAEKMASAGGRRTMLMTHHQPASAWEDVNTPLAREVAEAIGEERTLDAWLWGHEHRCAVYNQNLFAAPAFTRPLTRYAAVIGHGGVPQLLSQSSEPDRTQLTWNFADYYQLAEDRWGLGGFAELSFNADKVEIQYYDEYGKRRRSGAPFGYPAEAAGLKEAREAHDNRQLYDPDVLPA
jgi:hypothetical protein